MKPQPYGPPKYGLMEDNMDASATPTGLGAPEGAEPSRLGATPAIPSAASAPWDADWWYWVVRDLHNTHTERGDNPDCYYPGWDGDNQANADLISAAPDLLDALEHLLFLQDFADEREHWESEHRLGNGAAWRVLKAMDAIDKARGKA